jgi:hypothetical protein
MAHCNIGTFHSASRSISNSVVTTDWVVDTITWTRGVRVSGLVSSQETIIGDFIGDFLDLNNLFDWTPSITFLLFSCQEKNAEVWETNVIC